MNLSDKMSSIRLTQRLFSLKPYMTQTQRARLEEVQSEKAGITFNHVQRVSVWISPSEFELTFYNPNSCIVNAMTNS
jgi:hypothetical protein